MAAMEKKIALMLVALAILGAGTAHAQSPLSGQEKKILGMIKANWVSFRDFNGQQLIYFTMLESYRCGIAEVRFSINSDALDKVWRLQPCDPKKPNAITTTRPYLSLPLGAAKSIAVQLTYKDGTKSEIVHKTP
jgi:hypothetical protein